MKQFILPDLGEGLPDAEIREWHVKVGDKVKTDDVLVSMETAKAVVDVPAPFAGTIEKLHGDEGDIIKVGSVLVSFEGSGEAPREDSGTVVGVLTEQEGVLDENVTIIKTQRGDTAHVKATPAVKALAQRLGINLNHIQGTGRNGMITPADIKSAQNNVSAPEGFDAIKGSRRMMIKAMSDSHAQVCPVSIFDDADISAWNKHQDITTRLIRAVIHACQKEPAMNASFDSNAQARRMNHHVNLGIAVDSEEGLFVPVIHEADEIIRDPKKMRAVIDEYKSTIRDRSIEPEKLSGATITLSNFGTFAGRYATPIVSPPQVAIIGCGSLRQDVVAKDGKPTVVPILPLSVTFDHRAVTGGESTRFMGALIKDLSLAE